MRRKMTTILTEMVSLSALTMAIPTQAAEVNSSGYLDTYDKLQEYAWSLQYPEQGPFDIWLVSNEQGGARFVSNVPQTVFGSSYVRNRCWLPDDTADRIWGAQQLPQQTVLRAQQLEQKQTQLSAIFDAADYMYVSYGYGDQGISETFYLVPNVEKTIYKCYDAEGNLSYTIPYANAKSIVDQAMGEGQGLPCTGERCMIIWDSPYGLCAYDRYYRDYNSTYTADSNGEIVEVPVDMSGLKYTLDETVVANMASALNITVPHSDREQ